jgi:hypothetical protein
MFGMCLFCVCCPVFRYRPCDELITRIRSPTVCKMILKLKIKRPGPKGGVQPVKKKKHKYVHSVTIPARLLASY